MNYYTVISSHGMSGAKWRVYGTFREKSDAEFAAFGTQSPRRSHKANRTRVIEHHKPISKLPSPPDDKNWVVFADGTEAFR